MRQHCINVLCTLQSKISTFFHYIFTPNDSERYQCMNDKFKRAPRTAPQFAHKMNIFDLK